MREIKFRAWNEIDKLMVEWPTLKASTEFLGLLLTGKLKHFKPLQFTGAKSVDGIDIYDGDLIKCKSRSKSKDLTRFVGRVLYSKTLASYVVEGVNPYNGQRLYLRDIYMPKVIGNIYQNRIFTTLN